METQRAKSFGKIEIICGSMFSGKTKLLIKKITEAQKNNLTVKVFKPKIDTRYAKARIVTHDKKGVTAIPVEDPNNIIQLSQSANLVAIDEVQFFNKEIISTCEKLSQKNINIILAGLDLDYLGKPFGIMPILMKMANKITKLNAVCDICSQKAFHTYRVSKIEKKIVLGEKGEYLALCKDCFQKKIKHG